jgi:chaperonin GroEL (HSP60 family)
MNVNVLLCEQPLDTLQKEKLSALGIFALENVDKKEALAVSKATGAKIVVNLNELSEGNIGVADTLKTDRIELEKTVTMQGCKGATFLLRGTTPQIMDELEVAIKNSFVMLKLSGDDSRVLPGSGAIEAEIAQELKSYSREFASREQLVIDAFAGALMDIPRCLAENYGLNPTDAILELKKRHTDGFCNFGVDELTGSGIVCIEPLKVKRSVLRRALEVSTFMLRIDELLISKEIPKFHKK